MKVARLLALAFLCATSVFAGSTVVARKAALATSSPIATKVGLSVLRDGGNAIDASVAVAFTLAVVQPQSAALGGGGFLLYYDAASGDVWALDFAEVAPIATKRATLEANPETTARGAMSVATPGTVAGLAAMHEKFGSKKWKQLLAPALQLARDGFRVDDALAADLAAIGDAKKMAEVPSTAAIFYPDGKPLSAGSTLVQKDLAKTMHRLASDGARDFYSGDVAARIANGVHAAGGALGHRDLREYEARWRAPIQLRFAGHDVYAAPPPSGGALVIGEILNILGGFDLVKSGRNTVATTHLLVEAERRANIDRSRYLSDPAASRIAVRELLSAERAELWRRSIDATKVTPTASLTDPGALVPEGENTTHFTVFDAAGNIAALTTSLGDLFGSGFVAPGTGILLNDSMAQFAYGDRANVDGLEQSRVNAAEASRRVTSSLSPTLVLKNGKPVAALGTPGGAAIPTTVAQIILDMTVFGTSLRDAVAAPRFHHQGTPDTIAYERGRASKDVIDALSSMGHPVRPRESIGDVQAIQITNEGVVAVSDPRHGGAAGGY